jgi:hypothetical protein
VEVDGSGKHYSLLRQATITAVKSFIVEAPWAIHKIIFLHNLQSFVRSKSVCRGKKALKPNQS